MATSDLTYGHFKPDMPNTQCQVKIQNWRIKLSVGVSNYRGLIPVQVHGRTIMLLGQTLHERNTQFSPLRIQYSLLGGSWTPKHKAHTLAR